MTGTNNVDLNGFNNKICDISVDVDGNATFDKAISLTGYGRFHYKIIAVCALCLLTNGLQNGLSSYVFPAAQCDLKLTSAEIGFLNVAFLIGGTISSFLWGAIADLTGRRRVLIATLLLDFCVMVVMIMMQDFKGLAVCRFINGFLIGAPGSITFNYIAEFHASKQRTKSICYSGMFFTAAWLLLPIISFLILPLPNIDLKHNVVLSSWRLFMLIVSLPELIAGLWLFYLPESPKFVVEKGDQKRALQILQKMYAMNNNAKPEHFPVKCLLIESNSIEKVGNEVICSGKITRLIGEMVSQMQKLFKPPVLFITLLVCTIMFANMFGYFGLGLWLPELFMRFEQFQTQFPNKTVTVRDLASLKLNTSNINYTCNSDFDIKIFSSTLSVGVSSLIGNILSGWLSGKVNINIIPLVTMIIGGISSGSIYWLRSSRQNLIVSCIFQSAMATGNTAIGSVAVELFPTTVSAMALCLILCVGRIGAIFSNIVFGLLMDKHCEIPIFLVSVVVGIGAILCLLIPNSSGNKKIYLSNNKLQVNLSVIDIKT